MKLIKERSIAVVFDSVSISKDIVVEGGPLTLNFYAENQSFIPNRFLTPTTLTPKIFITDPNKIIVSGDKHKELLSCEWFENDKKIIDGSDYKIGKDNVLTVLKNSEKDFVISYKAIWYDPRKKQNITIEDSVQFVTISLNDGNIMPTLLLNKPLNWIHNPLKEERIYTIKALVSRDKLYDGAVEWYYRPKNGIKDLYIDNTMLFYAGGQLTNELKVDSAYMNDCIITAKNLSKDNLKQYYWFFDSKGNPISDNNPEYTDITGGNIISLPNNAMASVSPNYKFEGLTLNDIVNGKFKDKTNLTTNARDRRIDILNLKLNDVFYFKLMGYGVIDSKILIRFNSKAYTVDNLQSSGTLITQYVKCTDNSEKYIGFSKSTEDDTYISNVVVVNLTQTFGAGNEPSKEWCDEHIQGYFEGLKSVQAPMRVKSVGENLFNIKDAIPDSVLISLTDTGYIKPENSGLGITINLKLKPNIDYKFGYSAKGSARSSIKDIDNDSFIKPTGMWKNEVVNSGSGNLIWDFSTTSTDEKMETEVYNIYITENTDVEFTPYTESNLYINNQLELKSVGTTKDYIEDGKLYKNTKRYCFTKEDKWTLRKGYEGSNFSYYMNLPFKYKTTGTGVEGELFCNNFTPISNVPDVLTERESGTIALFRENSSVVYLTLGKKLDDGNSVIPEGTFIDVILPETEVTNLDTSGNVVVHPNGTILIEPIIKKDFIYTTYIDISNDYKVNYIESIKKGNYELDITKAIIKDNKITHPELDNGDFGTIIYNYDNAPILGNNTISYLSLENMLDSLWLEEVYTYKANLDSSGNVTSWELVKLIDIENYEEWLALRKESPAQLAPDGIVFGEYKADTKFLRQFPSSLYVDFIAPDRLKEGTSKIKVRAVVGTKDGILENPSRYFKITWLKRALKPGELDKVIGYGNELILDVSEKDSLTIQVEDLGILKALTDENGKYLINENNKILVGR